MAQPTVYDKIADRFIELNRSLATALRPKAPPASTPFADYWKQQEQDKEPEKPQQPYNQGPSPAPPPFGNRPVAPVAMPTPSPAAPAWLAAAPRPQPVPAPPQAVRPPPSAPGNRVVNFLGDMLIANPPPEGLALNSPEGKAWLNQRMQENAMIGVLGMAGGVKKVGGKAPKIPPKAARAEAAKPAAAPAQAAKEPWMMTRDDFINKNWQEYGGKEAFDVATIKNQEGVWIQDYQIAVREAIREGIRPPDNVLREFPEEIVGQWRHDWPKTFGEEKQPYATQGVPGVGYPSPLYRNEPWAKTWKEYRKGDFSGMTRKASPKEYRISRQRHKDIIQKALYEGKPVPPEVLADYPDLAAKGPVLAAPVTKPAALAGAREAGPVKGDRVRMSVRDPDTGNEASYLGTVIDNNRVRGDSGYIYDLSPSWHKAEQPTPADIPVVYKYAERPGQPKPLTAEATAPAPSVSNIPAQKVTPPTAAEVPPPQLPPPSGGKVPPSKPPAGVPPVPPSGPRPPAPATVPQGVADTLAQATATVQRDRPGAITRMVERIPGLKQVQNRLHPAIGMPENILVSHVGAGDAQAKVATTLQAKLVPALKQLENTFGKGAVEGKNTAVANFTGPAEKKVPFVGTLYDVMQRPSMYDLTTEQRALLADLQTNRSAEFNAIRDAYGLKVGEFPVEPGAVHLGNVDKSEMALEGAGSLQSAVSRGAAKERFYASGADRFLHDKAAHPNNPELWFKPVTDVGQLLGIRGDKTLANMAGEAVFKTGLGGKTRLEVLAETHPELYQKMTALHNRLGKLKGYANILKEEQVQAIDDFLASGAEDVDITALQDALAPKLTPGRYVAKSQAGRDLADVQKEMDGVKAQIAGLKKAWTAANPQPYVQIAEKGVYGYFPAEEAPVVRRLLKTSDSAALRTLDNIRATAFGGDLSPATIQGLNAMFLDPVRTMKTILTTGTKRLFSAEAMAADVRANPESWARFTGATGLQPLGSVTPEFATGFIPKIPKVGKAWERWNEAVYRPTQWIMKKSFDGIYEAGIKHGLTPEQAAAIAGDDVTKLIPNYSYRRLGMSQADSAKYRAALTSVSFLTQPASMLTDATKGLMKMGTFRWQSLTPSETFAAKRVLTLAAMTEAIAVASNAAYAKSKGQDVEQAIKDSANPASGYFMSLVLPNGARIGLGGPYRSIIRATWPKPIPNAMGGLPVPFAGVYNFARGKVAPGFRIAIDEIRNKDYYGKAIRTGAFPVNVLQGLEYATEGALPLTLGTVAEQVRRGETGEIPSRVASQFAGVNMVPEDPVYKMQVRWQNDLKAYNDLPTSTIEAKAKRLPTRAQYRERNPQVEAKLFITGAVSSVSSYGAANEVIRLVRENDIKPDAISGVKQNVAEQKKRAELGVRDTNISLTDRLVQRLMQPAPPESPAVRVAPAAPATPAQPTAAAPSRPVAPATAAPTAAMGPASQKWAQVSLMAGSQRLQALNDVWYSGKALTPQQEADLRYLFKLVPLGESDFNVWLKRTLRQTYENAVREGYKARVP